MIRPLTCISVLLACGSGLYLYQTKHHAQVVDRQIEHTVQAITATRMQTRELAAAWTLLGNPDRLQLLANQYLDIKPVQPSQFVALADLDSRLPLPRALPPPSATPDDSGSGTPSVASATPADGAGSSAPAAPAASLHAVTAAGVPAGSAPSPTASQAPSPVGSAQAGKAPGGGTGTSPAPVAGTGVAKAPATVASRPNDRQPADAPRPPREVAQTHPTPPHPAGSPPVIAELERPASSAPQRLAPAPQTGSLLGMAHIAVPAPVPLPISTAQFSSNHN
jgi:hypothetical protein